MVIQHSVQFSSCKIKLFIKKLLFADQSLNTFKQSKINILCLNEKKKLFEYGFFFHNINEHELFDSLNNSSDRCEKDNNN